MKPLVLAVIPARAQSKRIPGKNKKKFLGKPLIQWSIDAALAANWVTDVLVTTDDADIMEMNAQYPSVQFVARPPELALDSTPGVDPILDVMNKVLKKYDYIVLLQPTSPLRTALHIDRAFEQIVANKTKQLVSVKKLTDAFGHIVFKSDQGLRFVKNEISNSPADSDLKVLNGAIYISDWNTLQNERTFLGQSVELFEMEETVSVDIDYPEDWTRAERYARMEV